LISTVFAPVLQRLDEQFRGEFHATRADPPGLVGRLADAAEAGIAVGKISVKEHVDQPGENRRAEPSVQGGHRPRLDRPPHPRGDRHVGIDLDGLLIEWKGVLIDIGHVRIGEHHIGAQCRLDAAAQRRSVAARGDGHDTGSGRRCEFRGSVGAAIVGYDDFVSQGGTSPFEGLLHRLDTGNDRRLFVETGKNKGEVHEVGILDGEARVVHGKNGDSGNTRTGTSGGTPLLPFTASGPSPSREARQSRRRRRRDRRAERRR
jgi:hypothetical protein